MSVSARRNAKEEFTVWESSGKGGLLHEGKVVVPPADWEFVPSRDPGLTRRLKAAGLCWIQVHKRRNRIEAVGLWTASESVKRIRAELETERADPAYQRKQAAARRVREREQMEYEQEFRRAVLSFLAFHPRWASFAEKLADAVTAHAVPVGSGTVARTKRIPLEQRAEAAVIAWMRHQTTAYDNMSIPRVKGRRREVRRRLAEGSRKVLACYRSGGDVDSAHCPLAEALSMRCSNDTVRSDSMSCSSRRIS